MKKLAISIFVCVLPVFLIQSVSGQVNTIKKKSDDRVETALKESKLEFEIDDDGDFVVTFGFENGRSHVVYVNSVTSKVGSFEIREIWAFGYIKKDISSSAMRKLLLENNSKNLGSWSISKSDSKEGAVFTVQIPAEIDKETLALLLEAVAETADDMEKELAKNDDL